MGAANLVSAAAMNRKRVVVVQRLHRLHLQAQAVVRQKANCLLHQQLQLMVCQSNVSFVRQENQILGGILTHLSKIRIFRVTI